MARKIIAASIGYTDSDTSPTGNTLYVATESFTDSADIFFDGRLSGDISFDWRVAAPFTGFRPASGIGALMLSNHDGEYDDAVNWEFRDGAVTLKMLDPGQDWSAGTVIATTIAERVDVDELNTLRVLLRDPGAVLDRPLQSNVYTSAAVAPNALGKLKPYAFGSPLSVEPILVNASTRNYLCHESSLVDVEAVRDNGAEVAYSVGGGGGFSLSADATGRVTADPIATGTTTIKAIDNAVETDGGLLTNSDRTLANPYRISESPKVIDMTGYGEQARLASAGGKYYFELYVDWCTGNNTGPDYPDGAWGLQIGIGASQPTNPHRINNADEYSIWLRDQSSLYLLTWEDGSNIDTVTNPFGDNDAEGHTVGVLVNFDDMEVKFTWDGSQVGSTLSITANSPLDTFYPLIAAAGSNALDVRAQDQKGTLNLHDEWLSQTIPAGYVSWAGSAYSIDDGFTQFVTSITDKISGLTVDATSQTAMNDLGYSYSYYLRDTRSAAQVLFEGCASHTGWYYIGRTGSLTFGRLEEPAGTASVTFTDAEIISIVSIESDFAKGLSNRMGALRNWTKLNLGSVDADLDEDERVMLAEQFQHEAASSNTLASGYAHADGGPILPTYFRTAADADTEIDRLVALYGQERKIMVVDVAFDLDDFTSLSLGDTVGVSFGRYDFSTSAGNGAFSSGFSSGYDLGSEGSQYLLLGIGGNFASGVMRLVVWG